MGEDEVAEEMKVTAHMNQVLGGFSPQVLGYAELHNTAVLHLSLADLGGSGPKSFTDLFVASASDSENKTLQFRLENAVEFVFGTLCARLHWAESTEEAAEFCVADELGFCKDMGGLSGIEPELHMSSAWVLEKVWRKYPGDGGLCSSVGIHFLRTLGEQVDSDMLVFLDSHPLTLPNACSNLLGDHKKIALLRDASTCRPQLCFVHGDLHGDNIMIDAKDNRFLIDFGKTGLGMSVEDVTWLESFVLLSYTQLNTDAELSQALDLVSALVPDGGLSPKNCEETRMDELAVSVPTSGGLVTTWAVVRRLRHQLAKELRQVSSPAGEGPAIDNFGQMELIVLLLLLRNSIFFLAARENVKQPRRRVFAAALVCAYASLVSKKCGG